MGMTQVILKRMMRTMMMRTWNIWDDFQIHTRKQTTKILSQVRPWEIDGFLCLFRFCVHMLLIECKYRDAYKQTTKNDNI